MACTGCFTNCTQIISDQCVKYTGTAIAVLEIENGDPLSEVIEKLTDFLKDALNGEGIPTLPATICALIGQYLPISGDITLNDIISALVQACCELQLEVTAIENDITILNTNYTPGCLSVSGSAGTHAVLQSVITKLCALSLDVTALQSLINQYEKINDLCDDVTDCLTALGSTKYYNKMVPYTVVEYYGDLVGNFDAGGAGIGDWEQIYLCDGRVHNGFPTPDKRGRVPVGANTMSCAAYASAYSDTATPGNPNYDVYDIAGQNNVVLSTANLAAHTHVVPAPTVVDPGHRHLFLAPDNADTHGGYEEYSVVNSWFATNSEYRNGDHYYTKSSSNQPEQIHQTTGITISIPDTSPRGNSTAHENRPPMIAAFYIIYIPNP